LVLPARYEAGVGGQASPGDFVRWEAAGKMEGAWLRLTGGLPPLCSERGSREDSGANL
jgi:hypothetical protein